MVYFINITTSCLLFRKCQRGWTIYKYTLRKNPYVILLYFVQKFVFLMYTFGRNYNFILNVIHIFGQQNFFRLCCEIKCTNITLHAARSTFLSHLHYPEVLLDIGTHMINNVHTLLYIFVKWGRNNTCN